MSKDKIVKVPLEKILDSPNIIVLEVKKQDVFSEKKKKKIFNVFKSVPDFTYHVNHFRVEELIHSGEAIDIKEGQNITVRTANFQRKLKRHKDYYVKNVSKSRYVYVYETEFDLKTTEKAIVFVTYIEKEGIFEYKVQGAYDNPNKKEEILHLLGEERK